jgi:lipoprotein-anchoring transpeptidase ErfK/SrfK
MRRVSRFVLALAAFGLPGQALAQAFYIEPAQPRRTARPVQAPPHTGSVAQAPAGHQPGAYGGGFIELLMTGRDPTPGAYHRAQPEPRRPVVVRPEPSHQIDPFTGEPVAPLSRQMAGIQPRAEIERPIERMLDPRFHKQEVAYDGPHRPGTVVIDTPNKFLFLVLENGRALRYGIGVGRPGFEWAGVKSITRKAEWPDWRPPAQMLKRRPDLPRFMAGGPDNPMGARAMYLGSSLYRIHGTNEPHTIGQAVSSGCIRMTNDDVTDLYNRVRVGMRVIVI